MEATDILFSVMVPVLSRQITEAEPNDSTVEGCRVMIPFFAAALFGIFWWENQNISHLKALLLKEDPSIVFLPAGGISQQSN